MQFRSSRFIIITIITIVLPIIIYAIFSVSKLKENEKVIEKIYKEQLDGIIFSINQYSTDFLTAIIDDIAAVEDFENVSLSEIETIVGFSGLNGLYIKSMAEERGFEPLYESKTSVPNSVRLDSIYAANIDQVKRLSQYMNTGYRKIEPIQTNVGVQSQLFFAIILDKKGNQILLAGLINPGQFVSEVLSPKLQQISGEELIVVFADSGNSDILFSTDSLSNDVLLYEKMWLFSNIEVGISSKTATVSDLVAERLRSNLIASGLLVLLLITGLTLIIRNVNKETRLAQNKSDFVSNVSHELRTPLALISMFAETLSLNRVKSDEQKKEYINIIYRETARLTNMVNRILNFSRIEANERKYVFAKFDVKEMLQRLVSDYHYHLERESFQCNVIVPNEEIILFADHEAVYEAVVNLVDNAIKYSTEIKEINVFLTSEGDNILIKVQDKGLGIPQDKYEEIFDKFYRVTQGDLYTVKGTGLGLSIVKHIMEAHLGTVEVESELGKGSSFILKFRKRDHA